MTGSKRAENRAAMTEEILRLGRAHLSSHGAAGLSLRAIARDGRRVISGLPLRPQP